jgi:hypothetical protein
MKKNSKVVNRSGKLKQDRQYNDKRKRTKHNKWATKKYAEN